ncbi:MAG: hypothetical protein CMN58_04165 [Solibacterales bacterium]|nr:hypothetical protein [Bryobacterales bacterium]|tara:strand:- start:309 stop:1589 length:1281 start_codon:yes stop_codon:yes gene_type:complete
MTKVFPFQAWRYSKKAGPTKTLIAQPYDKITAELQESYYEANPFNIVRLIKRKAAPKNGIKSNTYEEAAETLETWITDKVLEQENRPSFYAYFQEFQHPENGQLITRKGFIGLMQVEDYSAGIVHRHELTHSGPKLDRLELTRHTRAHFGQLFMLYEDPEGSVDQSLEQTSTAPPLINVEDEFGTIHKIWQICDSNTIGRMQVAMADKRLLIADGHHRYETALAYSRENPDVPGADRVMMTFVNIHTPGLVVLATHRVFNSLRMFDKSDLLNKLRSHFEVNSFEDLDTLERHMNEVPSDKISIGSVFSGDPLYYLLSEKNTNRGSQTKTCDSENDLDVTILHSLVIERLMGVSPHDVRDLKHIRYVRGLRVAAEEVRSGKAQVAFLLRPVAVEKIAEISFGGGVMPQKSTDFYPKLQAGLTIYRFG